MTQTVCPDLWLAALLDRALNTGQAVESTPNAFAELLAALKMSPAEVRWFGENHRAELQPAVDEVVERVRLDAVEAPPLRFEESDASFVLASARWHERSGNFERAMDRLRYCRDHAAPGGLIAIIDAELLRLDLARRTAH